MLFSYLKVGNTLAAGNYVNCNYPVSLWWQGRRGLSQAPCTESTEMSYESLTHSCWQMSLRGVGTHTASPYCSPRHTDLKWVWCEIITVFLICCCQPNEISRRCCTCQGLNPESAGIADTNKAQYRCSPDDLWRPRAGACFSPPCTLLLLEALSLVPIWLQRP